MLCFVITRLFFMSCSRYSSVPFAAANRLSTINKCIYEQ